MDVNVASSVAGGGGAGDAVVPSGDGPGATNAPYLEVAVTATELIKRLAEWQRHAAEVRAAAFDACHADGASYGALSSATGLSVTRVAQILRRSDTPISGSA